MAESPADLAVAFRSFGRRLDEALQPTKDDPALLDAGQLVGVVASAAGEVRVNADGDVRTLGAAVGDAIARTPSEQWDEARLDRLTSLAREGGRILRQIDETLGVDR